MFLSGFLLEMNCEFCHSEILILLVVKSEKMTFLTCWKWFNGALKEANIQVTEKNQEKIDKFIHEYIEKESSIGHCSTEWKKARKEIKENPEMRKELVSKLERLRKALTINLLLLFLHPNISFSLVSQVLQESCLD